MRSVLIRPRDDEDELAARFVLPIMRAEFAERHAPELLEPLRQLTRSTCAPLRSEDLREDRKRLAQAVRCLVEDERLGIRCDARKKFPTLLVFAREEADEGKPIERQSCTDQRRERGIRTRQGGDGDARRDDTAREIAAGVGDARQARIADADDGLTRLHPRNELRALFLLVVLMVADHGRMDIIVREETARMPRVLGGDDIRRAQHLNGAVGDVAEVADGCPAQIELSRLVHRHSSDSFRYCIYMAQMGHCQARLIKSGCA